MNAKELSRRLAEQADAVAQYLLPQGKRAAGEWKVGSTKGEVGESLSVCVSGSKAGLWADFASDEKGDLLDLWAACRGISLGEAIRDAKSYLGIRDEPRREQKKTFVRPQRPKCQAPRGRVLDWLAGRGISDATVTAFRVGEQIFGNDAEQKFYAVFPFIREGELINTKRRNIDDKRDMSQSKGAEPCLFGWHLIDPKARMVAITEGEIDAMTLHQADIPALSVNQGAGNHQWIDSDWERLQQFDDIVLCYDADDAGRKGAYEAARRLGVDRCRFATFGESKDANDYLNSKPTKELQFYIDAAEPMPVEGTCTISSLRHQILRRYDGEVERGLPTGWDCMDKYYTVLPGEWTLVTGIPGHGKSEWLDALAMNLAKNHGWRFGVFSPENHPPEYHAVKMMEKYAGMPFDKGPNERMSTVQVDDAMAFIESHFTQMLPEDPTLDALLDQAAQLVTRKGIKGLILDPWNEIEHQTSSGQTETQYISGALTKIRRFCWTHGVHAWIVAHPAKLYKDKDTGKYPVPTPYDVSGSAHWRNKADNCIAVFRDIEDRTKPVEIHIQKIRKKFIGSPGMAELRYDFLSGRYTPWSGFAPVYSFQSKEQSHAAS